MTDLEKYLEEYKDAPDDELIFLSSYFAPGNVIHQAGIILLAQRRRDHEAQLEEAAESRHQEALAHDRALHRKTQAVVWIAVAVGTIGVLVGIWLHFHPVAASPTSTNSPTVSTPAPPAPKP
jgi:hypothetical protein